MRAKGAATFALALFALAAPGRAAGDPLPAGPDSEIMDAGPDSAAPSASPSPDATPQPSADGNLEKGRNERPARPRARFKSDLLLPFGSAFLPGFGQYFQGDETGPAYTGVALAGLALMVASLPALSEVDPSVQGSTDGSQGWPYRAFVLGGLAYQGSGFLSAYSAFRLAVPRFQAEEDRYGFLGPPESVGGLMLSPFRFDLLARPSAWIPLGLLAGAVGYEVASERTRRRGARWTASPDDYLFSGAESWNAGVTEEAVFRGWIYPVAYQYLWQNFWLADGAQALLFGAAHYSRSDNPLPWPQALLGFYFGWLAEKNGWTLSESVFVHAWWDVLIFAGEIATASEPADGASFRIAIPLRL